VGGGQRGSSTGGNRGGPGGVPSSVIGDECSLANAMRPPPFEPLPLREWRAVRLRAIRDGLIVSGWLATAFCLVVVTYFGRSMGYDAFAYWSLDFADPWGRSMFNNFTLGGFRYLPPIVFLFGPLGALPWWLFLWLWIALMVAAVIFLGRRWALVMLALPPVALELYHGNVHLLMAVAIAIGFRHPWSWSFVVLTKLTPGVGLLWFALRREWRSLAIALGATVAAVGATLVVAPQYWQLWWASIMSNLNAPDYGYSIPPPLFIRLPIAIVLVAWGALTDRPWTVPVGATIGLPLIWPHGLSVALAAVPFLRRDDQAARLPDWTSGARLRDLVQITVVVVGAALLIALVAAGPLEQLLTEASRNIDPYTRRP
jgi:hypothetical protein